PIERGLPTPRPGNGVPFVKQIAPVDAFPCKPFGPNDYVFMHVASNEHWARLLRVIGREELETDPRFAAPELRGANRAATNKVVADWLADKTKIEAMELLCRGGVAAGAVRDTLEVLQDGDLTKRGVFVTVQDPERGQLTLPGWPIKMSRSPVAVGPAPRPGQLSQEILQSVLGLSADELAALGVIPQHPDVPNDA
ncbi:MAG: CoA transferase, partial [Chloroflexota bacterium]|nr:CoA transferase [Chloroflexota bacterium]